MKITNVTMDTRRFFVKNRKISGSRSQMKISKDIVAACFIIKKNRCSRGKVMDRKFEIQKRFIKFTKKVQRKKVAAVIFAGICAAFFAGGMAGLTGMQTEVQAKTKVVKKDVTPKEPASSDLKVIRKVTKLASKRWIQSYTMDSKYYYYIQMTNAYKGNLRITRVKYKGLNRYSRDHMDLKCFGHATNLDCSVYNGKTWLWTGSSCKKNSDVSRAISGFVYKKNSVLYGHSSVCYKIPRGSSGSYATNVYPAVNENSTRMAVRYTCNGKQYYQIYALENGYQINTSDPIKSICLTATKGDFQGFDIYGTTIYSIEGSPRKSFLKTYDSRRVYQPTVIRAYNYSTRTKKKLTVHGAKRLSFREPEGIKVVSGKKIYIMYVSNKLTDQSCNIYRVKKKI